VKSLRAITRMVHWFIDRKMIFKKTCVSKRKKQRRK
jgi:uncharacterized protein (DUF2384 family)